MDYLTDRNEPQRRHWAVLLTITIHLAIGLAVYLSYDGAQQPAGPSKTTPTKVEARP